MINISSLFKKKDYISWEEYSAKVEQIELFQWQQQIRKHNVGLN